MIVLYSILVFQIILTMVSVNEIMRSNTKWEIFINTGLNLVMVYTTILTVSYV